MTLGDYTCAGLIIPRLEGEEVSGVLMELGEALQREGRIPEFLPFYQAALNREYLVSTDMEGGIAFPHARLPGLKEVSFAFGRSDAPLGWGRKSGRGVRMVFLLAVPATDSTQYLQLIAGLVRLTKDEGLLKKLREATDSFQILDIFRQVNLRSNGLRAMEENEKTSSKSEPLDRSLSKIPNV